ncbi:2-amino-4-hydroxy-6-hydroxymethyldihydropteridine diphosphokinase [Psychrobacter sp. M13]|uniref:2-amino-4-hydroxy-6- hydroxymethyldihydropteridine diphosphokinase n=1 Tax=Psychrobacter sp. M13 TaxID=3067275 RepID=UPI00273ACFB3|nr:2-amino-4-hydroxy-6-hydroxymethyldihydropteridine diphosphokinase [Psychrobacter sp. M13]WLP95706.1 2-amino-4-hydroxy-6-hydroxymethyldihydropteridine diphosphokinase [Psychrobacter sp. M13]
MTDQNLMLKNIDQLEMQTFEQLQAQTVSAAVISLGSNHQAEQHLATVHESLAKLGEIKLSKAYQNPDVTATPTQLKPDYINQCAYLALLSSMTLQQLRQLFKQFENDCNRQRQVKNTVIKQVAVKKVTMDIDTLLVRLEGSSGWIVMAERYPFKAHEMDGVGELAAEVLR